MNKITKLVLTLLIMAGCTFMGCNQVKKGYNKEMQSDTSSQKAGNNMDDGDDMDIHKAVAVIHSNKMDVDAWVTFTEVDQGVRVHGEFSGFPSGDHASHIHVYGDCRADDYSSAGPHLQFAGEDSLGSDNPITGNLGEFTTKSGKAAVIDTVIKEAEFENLIGRAVMVHEKGNDLSPPPPGQSGARIACGVIGYANTK